MAESTRRRQGELIRGLFKILMGSKEGMQAKDAIKALASSVEMTPYESSNYESGGRRFDYVVRFATIDPVKAGWLNKSKGRWTVTDEGKTAFSRFADPEQFYREAARLYHEWKSSRPDSEPQTADETEDKTSAKATRVTYEEAEEQAWGEIETYLTAMNPYDFQDLVAALLRGMGYYVAWISPVGKDRGIDILAWPDPLGTRLPRIKVQVKRQQQSVSVEGLRSFLAVLGDEDVGLFVCTGGFTKDAHDEARTQEKRRVTLVDLERLIDLWIEHYPKLDEQARRRLPLQPIWFLAPQV